MATSPAEHVARNARKFPERIALIDERGQLTYAALEAQTCHFASYLAARGVQRGDKVALLAKSSINWVVAFLAVLKLRATVVPLNYRLTPDDILGNVEDAECKLMITTSDYLASHVAGRIALPWALIDDSQTPESLPTVLRDAAASNTPLATFETATDDDLQIIMFTGGTTGRSKGVMLLNRHVFWNTVHEALDTGMTEFDNTILATPLHHAAALNCWLLPHLYLGATSTIMLEYSPQGLLDMIAAHGVTNGFTPPSMARDLYLVAADCPEKMASFRRWYVGGGVLSAKDREKMYALAPGVKIYYQYGLTEAGVIVTVLKDEDYALAPDSIGRPFVNFEVKIAREDLSWADTGEAGEILVRGPSVMAGYYKRPDATEQAFHDGWLRTGDMGLMDANGYVYFTDRLKDMVKTGGLNVYSQEVERVLQKHPSIREVAIIGLPSEKWTEEVTAIVVVHDNAQLTASELIEFSKLHLASYKTPKRVLFIEYTDLPINYSGKIIKRTLRTQIELLLASEKDAS